MDMESLEALVRSSLETQEVIKDALLKMNAAPNVATPIVPSAGRGVEDQPTQSQAVTRRFLTPQERMETQDLLRTKSLSQLLSLFSLQAAEKNTGIPLDVWLNTAGFSAQNAFNNITNAVEPDIAKAIDSSGVSALIRQDLEPLLYEVFIRIFPAYDRMAKEPANGLLHAWNQITDYGAAKFMAELGTVSDDKSTYARKSTNVAILATRRGISLKGKFAVMAGGMNYNPEQIELQGGLRAMAHTMQKAIFEGQATDSGGTADNELGLYDENGFDGLRSILNTASVINFDPATNPTTTGNFRKNIDAALLPVIQAAGRPSIIWAHPQEKITFDEQQDPNVRILSTTQTSIGVGVTADTFNTIAGSLPMAVVPGDSIADYHAATYSGNKVRDLYMLDESTITLPYLGAPGPTVLEIPIGISGQLTHLYVIFMMNGLAVKVLPWNNKLRVKVV